MTYLLKQIVFPLKISHKFGFEPIFKEWLLCILRVESHNTYSLAIKASHLIQNLNFLYTF